MRVFKVFALHKEFSSQQLFVIYRKILNDLSSDAPGVPRIEEEKSEEDTAPSITTVTVPTPIYQTSSGQYSTLKSTNEVEIF